MPLCRLARASQTYLFPVHLTDQLLPSAVFYATVGPLLVYMAVHRLIIIPYTQAQKEQSVHLLLTSFNLTLNQHLILPHFIFKLFVVCVGEGSSVLVVANTIRLSLSFTHAVIIERLHNESQWVIVDVCFFCLCASQRAGAAEEELRHRHRQEEAGGRVCREYSRSHATTHFIHCVWGIIDHCV